MGLNQSRYPHLIFYSLFLLISSRNSSHFLQRDPNLLLLARCCALDIVEQVKATEQNRLNPTPRISHVSTCLYSTPPVCLINQSQARSLSGLPVEHTAITCKNIFSAFFHCPSFLYINARFSMSASLCGCSFVGVPSWLSIAS